MKAALGIKLRRLLLSKTSLCRPNLRRFLGASGRTYFLVLCCVRKLSIEAFNFDRYEDPHKDVSLISALAIRAADEYLCGRAIAGEIMAADCLLSNHMICGGLVALAGYLTHMTKLETLRLKVSMKLEDYEWNEGLCTTAMATVISSLPTSITTLTIDNPSDPPSENTLDPNDHHSLCHLLLFQELAPSLRHLSFACAAFAPGSWR
jgi:hypothetical protein